MLAESRAPRLSGLGPLKGFAYEISKGVAHFSPWETARKLLFLVNIGAVVFEELRQTRG